LIDAENLEILRFHFGTFRGADFLQYVPGIRAVFLRETTRIESLPEIDFTHTPSIEIFEIQFGELEWILRIFGIPDSLELISFVGVSFSEVNTGFLEETSGDRPALFFEDDIARRLNDSSADVNIIKSARRRQLAEQFD
jgi:hypothetical protein